MDIKQIDGEEVTIYLGQHNGIDYYFLDGPSPSYWRLEQQKPGFSVPLEISRAQVPTLLLKSPVI